MFRKKRILAFPFLVIGICSLNSLQSEILIDGRNWHEQEEYFEIPENQTLSYRANLISGKKGKKKDKNKGNNNSENDTIININKLVKDGLSTCYNAYKSKFDEHILQERQLLVSYGQEGGSYLQSYIIRVAKSFSEVIINQMNSLVQRFSPNERQVFWNIAGLEVKQVIGEFCKNHGCELTGDLDQHIDNQINMKQTFG